MAKYNNNMSSKLQNRILTKIKEYGCNDDVRIAGIILNPEDGYYAMGIAELVTNVGVPVSIYGISVFFDKDKQSKSKILCEFIHKDDRYYSKGKKLVIATICEEL